MKGFMLLWSESQKCFHIGEADNEMEKNRRMFMRGTGCTDYITLAIFATREEANRAAELSRALRETRGQWLEV